MILCVAIGVMNGVNQNHFREFCFNLFIHALRLAQLFLIEH